MKFQCSNRFHGLSPIRNISYLLPMCCSFWEKCINSQKNGLGCSTPLSYLVLPKCFHMIFSQFKFPANLAQLVVPKIHYLYANAVVQPIVQHCPCYMAWKTKVHTRCRHCHLCINAPMWREKRWLQGLLDPPSYYLISIWTTCWWNLNKIVWSELYEIWIFLKMVNYFWQSVDAILEDVSVNETIIWC